MRSRRRRRALAGAAGLLCLALGAAALAEDIRTNELGMSFVRVPAGTFTMGTHPADAERIIWEMETPEPDRFDDEMPAHEVVIGHDFWLQQTEVTQEQWLEVMENRPGPAEHWEGEHWGRLPVVSISWNMAQRFIEELNRMDERFRYRLPSEAEWEYAARAGTTGVRPHPPEELGRHAWFIHNSGDEPHPVASREANAFGLHDMLGNVWEWVQDHYAPDTYQEGRRIDPLGPEQGRSRVRRGGSYHCALWQLRPAYRSANPPDTAFTVIGFRLVAEEIKR